MPINTAVSEAWTKQAMVRNDTIIINQKEPLSGNDLDALQRKGFSLIFADSPEDAASKITGLSKPVIIINCSQTEFIEPFIDLVCREQQLNNYPAIFISKIVAGLESRLNRIFPLAVALQQPADTSKIIEAVRFISRNYRDKLSSLQISEDSANEDQDFQERDLHTIAAEIKAAKDLFAELKGCNLQGNDIGGDDLPLLLSGYDQSKNSEPLLPHTEKFRIACQTLLSSIKISARKNLERVNILALKIASPLNIEAELLERIKAASILYAQAFASQNRILLSKNYDFKGAHILRKDICSAIKDSALNVGGDLADRDLSAIISGAAKLIGHESCDPQSRLAQACSAIVAADLLNRSCHDSGIWNAGNAYRLLRRIRQGKFNQLHPSISCIIVKLLAEGLASPANRRLMGSKYREDQTDEYDSSIKINEEALVDLPSLTAGMKLARPLMTEDGRPILEEDLILDEDLILRIWQLSSLRLINKAVIKRMH